VRWDGRARMPKIAETARAARRGQIVDAALACFAFAGYYATTMGDVAAQAGVSKGTPYLYFDSKQALFIALHEEWDCGLADRVNAAIDALPEAGRRSARWYRPGAGRPVVHRRLVRADGPVAPGAGLVLLGGRGGRGRRRRGAQLCGQRVQR